MRPDKDDIEKSLERSFPSASTEQVESARARIYDRLRSDSAPLAVSAVKDVPSRTMSRFSRRLTPARIAACFVAVVLTSAVFYRAVLWPDDVYAVVETTDGPLVQISQGRTSAANVGDIIPMGTTMRTGSGAEAKLKLPDGSRIEMQPESELSWQRADDGLHIQLKQGSVNVTPAEEAVGKLYVQNREQLVPVMGAIFQSAAAPTQASIPAGAPPKWDIVSIRLCENTGGVGRGAGGGGAAGPRTQFDPVRMVLACQTPWQLVSSAYVEYANGRSNRLAAGTANWTKRIEGLPAWAEDFSERYTIEAKADKPVDSGVMRGPMLQAILEDRFKLKVRREDREVPVLALTVAGGGAKLKPHQEGSCRPEMNFERRATFPAGTVFCNVFVGAPLGPTARLSTSMLEGVTIEELIGTAMMGVIAGTGKPIVDKTGITGKFDFKYEHAFTPQQIKNYAQLYGRPESDFDTSPTLTEVMENQFGLKLVETKGPWPHVVIEHVERPSPN
jgi:uncharacterized protein (TIGR03435 family)